MVALGFKLEPPVSGWNKHTGADLVPLLEQNQVSTATNEIRQVAPHTSVECSGINADPLVGEAAGSSATVRLPT